MVNVLTQVDVKKKIDVTKNQNFKNRYSVFPDLDDLKSIFP